LGSDREQPQPADEADAFDAQQIVDRVQGRQGWARAARRQLEAERWQTATPIARSREQRLRDAAERLEDDLAAKSRGMRAYEAYRARGQMKDGRRFGRPPNPPMRSWRPLVRRLRLVASNSELPSSYG
jgi:hypothetical protein